MEFSDSSDVTVVITSCGRFNLLKKTLDSFFQYNTYPINKIIITEDSGDDKILSVIPEKFKKYFNIIINKTKLGQIKSIDKAYNLVETDYIFHCEDDWEFYRSEFIEDSKKILKNDKEIFQVWLRSYYHDVKNNVNLHFQGPRKIIDDIPTYKVVSEDPNWHGFSFNPGLRRLSDYRKIKGGYYGLFKAGSSAAATESNISSYVHNSGQYAVILENDAVAHIGDGQHVLSNHQKRKKTIRKIRELLTVTLLIIISFLLGTLI
ncbi:glycosyltransferase family 2 protein [Endozoicomonas sp. Mp262]|uniref:glycosyltransferase family 2 protein n=1 Tax=Endozoicomonas sp. Mp262 TaxID=2919499 RepID=UPI0021DAC50E